MGLNETFAALSVPLRRDIIMQLRGGKLTAGEISSKFNVTNSDISYPKIASASWTLAR